MVDKWKTMETYILTVPATERASSSALWLDRFSFFLCSVQGVRFPKGELQTVAGEWGNAYWHLTFDRQGGFHDLELDIGKVHTLQSKLDDWYPLSFHAREGRLLTFRAGPPETGEKISTLLFGDVVAGFLMTDPQNVKHRVWLTPNVLLFDEAMTLVGIVTYEEFPDAIERYQLD